MFGIFRRKKSAEEEAVEDIESTLLIAFARTYKAVKEPDNLLRIAHIVASLAAMVGALRSTYRNLPIEDESLAMALIEANASGQQTDVDALAGALKRLLDRCPDYRSAKIDTMLFLIAPKMMQERDASRQ